MLAMAAQVLFLKIGKIRLVPFFWGGRDCSTTHGARFCCPLAHLIKPFPFHSTKYAYCMPAYRRIVALQIHILALAN
jgi:hypothetical protein